MKYIFSFFVLGLAFSVMADKAPDFSLKNHQNKEIKLSQFKDKIVVLEWFNKGCPFVKKFYESKKMQKLQEQFTDQNVVWLTMISSVKGRQGYETYQEASKTRKSWGVSSTHTLLDHQGVVGKLYGAKTTPHIFIISKDQKIVYQGAIDSIPSGDPGDISKANNYIEEGLKRLHRNKKIKLAKTKPYGCSVKY